MNEDSDDLDELQSPDPIRSRATNNLLQKTKTQYEPDKPTHEKFQGKMPTIPEHFEDGLTPRGLKEQQGDN